MARTLAPTVTPTPTPTPTPTRGVYRVPSRTDAGAVYTTDIRDRAHPACTCPAGQHAFETCTHVRVCWHVRACIARQDAALYRWARLRARCRPCGQAALQECFA